MLSDKAVVFVFVIVILIFVLGVLLGFGIGFKSGQIDALNGEVYYRLEKQEDNSMDWVSCNGLCEMGE